MNAFNEEMARRFLLGELSSEERERIQELAFADPDIFALIESAQDDLIDDFVNDELSAEERERFQNYFLVQPGRRQDLRIGRALQQYWTRIEPSVVVPKPRPRPSIFDRLLRPAIVAPALLTLIIAVGLLSVFFLWTGEDPPLEARKYPTPPPPTPAFSPAASPAVTPAQATPSPAQAPTPSSPSPTPRQSVEPIYSVVLTPGFARSESVETKLRPVSGPVNLELPLIDYTAFQSYHATLEQDGKTIKTWPRLRPKQLQTGRGVEVTAEPGLLQNLRQYRIALSGVSGGQLQNIHSYYFVVSN